MAPLPARGSLDQLRILQHSVAYKFPGLPQRPDRGLPEAPLASRLLAGLRHRAQRADSTTQPALRCVADVAGLFPKLRQLGCSADKARIDALKPDLKTTIDALQSFLKTTINALKFNLTTGLDGSAVPSAQPTRGGPLGDGAGCAADGGGDGGDADNRNGGTDAAGERRRGAAALCDAVAGGAASGASFRAFLSLSDEI